MAVLDIPPDRRTETGGEVGMTREDAVKGLRNVADWHYGKYEQTHEEDYLNDGDFLTAVADMLKAQEARVMTLEEIPYAVFGWMEMFGQLIPCVLEDVYADDTVGFANLDDGHDYICASDYNKTWRCWTSLPTDEQREATPWLI